MKRWVAETPVCKGPRGKKAICLCPFPQHLPTYLLLSTYQLTNYLPTYLLYPPRHSHAFFGLPRL